MNFHRAQLALVLAAGLSAAAQTAPTATPAAPAIGDKPKYKVSLVNSCRPSPADASEMRHLLEPFRAKPAYSGDFEIARGVTTLSEAEALASGVASDTAGKPSHWVRLSRDLTEKSALSGAQYSLSHEDRSVTEVLVLHLRNTDKAMQIVFSSTVTGSPEQVLRTLTPPDHIRIERYGHSSLMLARCPVDQALYEPLFTLGREIFATYRETMGVERIVPEELERLNGRKESKSPAGNQ
ncbi:MAG: hypothetical protein P4M01_12265 [Acidobacteriota bacterium]|nr:hypothetical protein [Acidobacteriota bacterium]